MIVYRPTGGRRGALDGTDSDRARRTGQSVWGSAVRGELKPDSDVDLLVEFDPDRRPGLVGMHELEQELSTLFGGRRVDLVNRKYLNRRICDRVLAEAEVQFAEG
ncbi:MAG: nucleotidyltransferase domain-containing protein [Bryobacterales bacterium]|nr:nucleotidyltransferase domain-containing protein [Bryobacterales bacterium]